MILPVGLDPNPNPITTYNVKCRRHALDLREIARAVQRLNGHNTVVSELLSAAAFLEIDAIRPQPGQPDQLT